MTELLKRISQLDKGNRVLYLQLIYENQDTVDLFHSFLKSADEQEIIDFLDSMDENYRQILLRKLEMTDPVKDEDRGYALKVLTGIFDKVEIRKRELDENTKEALKITLNHREDLKSSFGVYKEHLTDQMKGIAPPSLSKSVEDKRQIIELPEPDEGTVVNSGIFHNIESRKSRRKYSQEPLSIAELSYLLWATQGVKKTFKHNIHALRTVPSAGARHPFETYLAINHVEGLEPGLYRYLPFEHSMEYIGDVEDMESRLIESALGQVFAGQCAVSFIWTVVPYRTEWRYTVKSSKIILLDAGHLAQNLYLACESINCGTCAIGAYDQKKMDEFLGVDGKEEFAIYLSPVGKLNDVEN